VKKNTRQLNFDLKTCCSTCASPIPDRRKYSDNGYECTTVQTCHFSQIDEQLALTVRHSFSLVN